MRFPLPALGLVALMTLALVAAPPAFAQQQSPQQSMPGPQMQQGRSQARQLQTRLRSLSQKLQEIQKQALEKNPELKEERQALQALVQEKMKDEGASPEADRERLEEIRGELAPGNEHSSEKRQALVKEFRQVSQGLRGARQTAMKDPEVREADGAYRESLVAAMKEVDPQTEELVQEFRQTRQQLQQIIMQQRMQQRMRRQQQGGGPQRPQGSQGGGPQQPELELAPEQE